MQAGDSRENRIKELEDERDSLRHDLGVILSSHEKELEAYGKKLERAYSENRRLREALEEISQGTASGDGYHHCLAKRARAALEKK